MSHLLADSMLTGDSGMSLVTQFGLTQQTLHRH
jgi:hypothetical protein